MAKIKFSMMVSDMRGKLNGSVFAKNKGGNYVRNKVTPANPQTSYQQAIRSLFSRISKAWRSLTQLQIAAWNQSAASWGQTNVFGDIVNPSGSQVHQRLNMDILAAGGVGISAPPLPSGVDSGVINAISVDLAVDELMIDYSGGPVASDHAYQIEATVGMSAGVSNANSKFRNIATAPAGTDPNSNFWTAYTAKFGLPVEGTKIFVRAYMVNLLTGETSLRSVASAIVTN